MGARGHDAFSNDHALDGVDGLLAAGDTGPVQGALAAAEIVAAVRGKTGAGLPKKLVAWQAGKSKSSDALLDGPARRRQGHAGFRAEGPLGGVGQSASLGGWSERSSGTLALTLRPYRF